MTHCIQFSLDRKPKSGSCVLTLPEWRRNEKGERDLMRCRSKQSSCNCFSLWFLFFFFRKISPEVTSANPPFFAEEDWLWTNFRAHLPLLYMWDAYHSMACEVLPCPHLGSEPANPRPLRCGTCELNRCATGPAPWFLSEKFLVWVVNIFSYWKIRGSLISCGQNLIKSI